MDKNLNSILTYICNQLKTLKNKKNGFKVEDYSSYRLSDVGDTWKAPSDGILLIRVDPPGSDRTGTHYISTSSMNGVNEIDIANLLCMSGAATEVTIPVRKDYTYRVSHSTYISKVRTWFFAFES